MAFPLCTKVNHAKIAQLVEHDLARFRFNGSRPWQGFSGMAFPFCTKVDHAKIAQLVEHDLAFFRFNG